MRSLIAIFPRWAVVAIVASTFCQASRVQAEETSTSAAPTQAGSTQAAGQLVAQAIDAEIQSDLPRRGALLEQARRAAPDFAPARWQSGQVQNGNDWMSVDASVEQATHDELLAEYREMRAKYHDSKEGQLVLTRWCQKHQLTDEMRAHAVRLLDQSPNDPEVIKMLGLSWHEGLLLTPAELAERKVEAEQAKALLKTWQPRLTELRRQLESHSPGERDVALEKLGEIRDPNAIGALEVVFKNHPTLAGGLVAALGHIPGQKATDALLRQSMLAKHEDVRLAACEQLRLRAQQGYVPTLMGALSTPLQTKLEVVRDAEGVHFVQTIRREGATSIVEKSLQTDVTLLVPNPNLGAIIGEVYSETLLNAKNAAKTAAIVNHRVAEFNNSIYWILEHTTGQSLPHEPQYWWTWWHNYNELSTSEKPTLADKSYQSVDVPYVPTLPTDIPIFIAGSSPGTMFTTLSNVRYDECFAKGTKVWTLAGLMPIEEVQIGDRVLSQSPASGELTYKAVLDVTLGSQALIAIDVGSEQITATRGHVFWVSGKGWRMAKQLNVGDRLHDVSGWVEISSLKPIAADETHNLVVADFNTYFVGDSRILVHDVTMLRPTTALVPGQPER